MGQPNRYATSLLLQIKSTVAIRLFKLTRCSTIQMAMAMSKISNQESQATFKCTALMTLAGALTACIIAAEYCNAKL